MRCPDGAVRASYNVQIAATTDHGFVTAIMATDRRNDSGLVRPMFEESEQRLGRPIKRVLADTGFAQVDDIAALSSRAEAPVGVYIHPAKQGSRRRQAGDVTGAAKGTRTRAADHQGLAAAHDNE